MTRNNLDKIRKEQRGLGMMELRFTVMRMFRTSGVVLLPIAVTLMLVGFGMFMWLILGWDEVPAGRAMPAIIIGTVCLLLFPLAASLGIAITSPYMYDSEMPNKAGRTRCMSCGHPIPSNGVLIGCKKCGSAMPIPVLAIVARILGRGVTATNIIVFGSLILLAVL